MTALSPFTLSRSLSRRCSGFCRRWGVEGLHREVSYFVDARLSRSLARADLDRQRIRISPAVTEQGLAFQAEVLCHELAHFAARRRKGPEERPHGEEWRHLVKAAGYQPAVRLALPAESQPPPVARTPRGGYRLEYRCPVCSWQHVSRTRRRRAYCPQCKKVGLETQLEIRSLPSDDAS